MNRKTKRTEVRRNRIGTHLSYSCLCGDNTKKCFIRLLVYTSRCYMYLTL